VRAEKSLTALTTSTPDINVAAEGLRAISSITALAIASPA
jgi:hypothetical protein